MSQTQPESLAQTAHFSSAPSSPVHERGVISSTDDEYFALMTPGPQPGLNGVPVRWYDADRSEPYTRIVPFDRTNDTSVGFFFKPATLTALAIMLAILAYVAISKDVLEEGRDKQLLGIYSTIVAFLTFSLVQFRDGPFLRPHPAFWRVVLGVNLIYELGLVFLLFQDLDSARTMMKYLDPSLGVPLPEKSYTEDCTLTLKTLWGAIDIFCLAHSLGWFGKALILRDYWFCWILSVAFELAEYSLSHQLPNFNECWWDHWLLDVLICNWAGISLGMRTCAYFEVKRYVWRGFRETRGIRKKSARVVKQLTPQSWTTFKWEGTRSFVGYVAVVSLLTTFLVAELNVFYLKALLWMGPEHKFVIARLAGMFLCALPATRELYQYLHETQRVVRMGQHAWLLLATVLTELLIIVKFGRGQFPEPFPTPVKVFFASLVFFLIAYPSIKFGIPAVRRTAKQSIQPLQTKAKDHDAKND